MLNVFVLSYGIGNTDQLPEFPDQDMVFTTILEELTLSKLVKRIWMKDLI